MSRGLVTGALNVSVMVPDPASRLAASVAVPGVVSQSIRVCSDTVPCSASSPKTGTEFSVSLAKLSMTAPPLAVVETVTVMPFDNVVEAPLPPAVQDPLWVPIVGVCPLIVNTSACVPPLPSLAVIVTV